jgi:flavin reductase (DIM6/NTAB) family NADH-FMN oxidoreductase RutF
MEKGAMDTNARKTALRMLPYGLSVLTAADAQGRFAGASLNWVTQASFQPPQLVVCLKQDSSTLNVVEAAGEFALNLLGKEQGALAFTFFKHVEEQDGSLGGVAYQFVQGIPVLDPVPAYLLCRVSGLMGDGDHKVVLGEVVDAGVRVEITGRPDEMMLWLRDLEGNLFYGG